MAMQWFRRTQVTGLPGQVVDLIRYRDGQRLARYTVPAGGVVQVEYLESLGECALLLHERGEETVGLWQASTAVARNALLYSPLFPGRVLRCAKPGTTGSAAPTPAAIKLGWLHIQDLNSPLADFSVSSDNVLWGYASTTLWNSEQDGSPATVWPREDVLHYAATANHLVGLRYDGTLLVKNINAAYATAYASLKALTDVVHVTASQFAFHAHRASGEVVSVIDSSSYDTTPNRNLLAGAQPCPGFGAVNTTAMRIVGGVIQSANASQQSAVSAFTDVVYAITNSALLIALVRANGEVRLIDPAVPANNVTIAAGSLTDPVVQLGATARSVYAVGARGRRWVLANNEVGGASSTLVLAEVLAGFQGVPPEQLQLVSQPYAAGTSRLLVSTPDSVAYLYKADYPSSSLGRRRIWKTPRFRILVNGTASFYVEPYAAALLQPVWERVEQEISVSQGRVQCAVAVDGEGAARQLLAMSWPVGDTPRVLWQGRSAADGTAEAIWSDPVPGEQALVVALDDWGSTWLPGHAYVQGDVIRPTGVFAGVVYVCITAGTSSSTEPTWWAEGQGAIGSAVFEARPYRRPLAHGPITPTVTSS